MCYSWLEEHWGGAVGGGGGVGVGDEAEWTENEKKKKKWKGIISGSRQNVQSYILI